MVILRLLLFLFEIEETYTLILCMLCKSFSWQWICDEFSYFLFYKPEWNMTFHVNCLLKRQFAWTAKFCCRKNKKTFKRQFAWNFKSSCVWKEEINITNTLFAELAEEVLEVNLLLSQMGRSSKLSLFTYGVSKTSDIRHILWVPSNGKKWYFISTRNVCCRYPLVGFLWLRTRFFVEK